MLNIEWNLDYLRHKIKFILLSLKIKNWYCIRKTKLDFSNKAVIRKEMKQSDTSQDSNPGHAIFV